MEIGKRISGPAATGTTITGLSSTEEYDVYVVGISSVGETFPAAHAIPVTDTTPPTVSATPNGGTSAVAQTVTLKSSETGSDIYYTIDGSEPVLSGGVLSESAKRYTAPMEIATTSTLKFAAFDPSGNVSTTVETLFTVTNDPVPSAPAFASAPVVGQGTATLSWTAPNPGAAGLTITGYTVQAYTGDTAFGAPKTVAGDVTTLVYDGLSGDTAYTFTVRATNVNGTGPESPKTAAATVQGAVVAIAGPDQNVVRRTTATPVTLDGTGSTTAGATYKWEQVLSSATDPNKISTLTGATTLKPTFSLPVFRSPMTNDAAGLPPDRDVRHDGPHRRGQGCTGYRPGDHQQRAVEERRLPGQRHQLRGRRHHHRPRRQRHRPGPRPGSRHGGSSTGNRRRVDAAAPQRSSGHHQPGQCLD